MRLETEKDRRSTAEIVRSFLICAHLDLNYESEVSTHTLHSAETNIISRGLKYSLSVPHECRGVRVVNIVSWLRDTNLVTQGSCMTGNHCSIE